MDSRKISAITRADCSRGFTWADVQKNRRSPAKSASRLLGAERTLVGRRERRWIAWASVRERVNVERRVVTGKSAEIREVCRSTRRWRTAKWVRDRYYARRTSLARSYEFSHVSRKTLNWDSLVRSRERGRGSWWSIRTVRYSRVCEMRRFRARSTQQRVELLQCLRPGCYHKTGQLTESRADPQLSGWYARARDLWSVRMRSSATDHLDVCSVARVVKNYEERNVCT